VHPVTQALHARGELREVLVHDAVRVAPNKPALVLFG
jgi:hypothetical protein